jgi:surfeit locus 1 family protein
MSAAAAGSRRSLVLATVFAMAGVAFLLGLCKWQLDRHVEKENLIAATSSRLNVAPQPLPPRADWPRLTQANDEYRRVKFSAEFANDREALVYTTGSKFRPDVSGPGYWVFTPAKLADGGTVAVNRGFVPLGYKDPAGGAGVLPDKITVVGVMRWPEPRGAFTPADDPSSNVWYVREPQAIAAAKHWGAVAPFYIEQESPQAPGGWPHAGKLKVSLANYHLDYAFTWFLLAMALISVYGSWMIGNWRR